MIRFTSNLPEVLTHELLTISHRVGYSETLTNSKNEKIKRYVSGLHTSIGDIEESVWAAAVDQLAEQTGEQAILDHLRRWTAANIPWLNSDKDRDLYARGLYAGKIWERPGWPGYEEFQQLGGAG